MQSVDVKDLENYKGKDMGHSDWMSIDQNRINLFANATDDHQWIHVNEEKAQKELPTKSTIAHGFLSLSLSVPLAGKIWTVTGAKMMINYGLNKVRFINMVPVNSRVRMGIKIKEVNKFSPEILINCKNSINKSLFDLDFQRLDKGAFKKCDDISIDVAV